ncbi:hypothetical protein CHARACLAT_006323 [Characodon lateralis]|uniref:Uncharacterized protein n=1 Tax=Characodon lateralis TaxID=208331 RepID=A0ABU7DSH2_9TELE|nr:hypothetical protein [Characodon lateralis]
MEGHDKASRRCLLRAGWRAEPAGRAGWAGLQAGPLRDGEEKRNFTDPVMARKTRLQTADLSSSSTQPFLSWTDCLHGCTRRTNCLRLPVSMSEPTGQTEGTQTRCQFVS